MICSTTSSQTRPENDACLRDQRLADVRQGRLTTGPETLQVNMGNRCNLNCIFCWNHSPLLGSRSKKWSRRRLSDSHLDSIIDALPRLRPGHIVISGQGEPLIHPELKRLLSAALHEHIPVSIQTNGIAGIEMEELCELDVARLIVNLSAATKAAYELTHPGNKALLARVTARLEHLAQQRERRKAPEVTLVAVIQRSNHEELVRLVELASRVRASAVYFKGLELVPGLEQLSLDDESRIRVRDELASARCLAQEHNIKLDSAHLEQVISSGPGSRTFTGRLSHLSCYMGWYYLRVTCDGEVMFCCKDKKVGHLDQNDLYRIWRSPVYHMHRLAARDRDRSTGILDSKCRACSNFARNVEIGRLLEARP